MINHFLGENFDSHNTQKKIYSPTRSLNKKDFSRKNENSKKLIFRQLDAPLIKVLEAAFEIYAEVVTFVAGSLEAGGLPGSLEIPEVLK